MPREEKRDYVYVPDSEHEQKMDIPPITDVQDFIRRTIALHAGGTSTTQQNAFLEQKYKRFKHLQWLHRYQRRGMTKDEFLEAQVAEMFTLRMITDRKFMLVIGFNASFFIFCQIFDYFFFVFFLHLCYIPYFFYSTVKWLKCFILF